ncbi:hypothetical protein [Pseudoalteromonas sp.]|uniref:hypothetical protein n=1 Tax=Pseudoalteromonas sp. TaxID=53249 RepID=UPI00351570ED
MNDFSCLKTLYEKSASYNDEDGFLYFKVDNLRDFEDVIGYLAVQEVNKRLESKINEESHIISLKKVDVNGLYKKKTEFLSKALKDYSSETVELPDEIYIIEETIERSKEIKESFENLKCWMMLFENVSDHVEFNSSKVPSYIFIVDDEDLKTITKYKLELEDVFSDSTLIDKIPSPSGPSLDQDFKLLLSEMKNGDIHSAEKRLVLRSSIIDLIKDFDNAKSLAVAILKKPKMLWAHFSNQYEFYVRRFSLDKIKREVETEKIEYIKKINEQLQDHLTKSLVIPSIMVAIALIKSWSPESIIVIFFALVLSIVIVLLGLNTRKIVIEDIKDSAVDVLKIIEKTKSTDNEIINTKIHDMVDKASNRVVYLANKAIRNVNIVFLSLVFCILILFIYSILNIFDLNGFLLIISKISGFFILLAQLITCST